MKRLLLLVLFCLFPLINTGYAFWCPLDSTPVGSPGQTNNEWGASDTSHCTGTEVKYFNWTYYSADYYYQITSCTSCSSGYYLRPSTTSMPCAGDTSSQYYCGRCSYTFNECIECTSCSSCTTTNWSTYTGSTSGNTRKRTVKTCVNTCCKSQIEYSCPTGYYGMADEENDDCALCPRDTTWKTNPERTTNASTTSDVGYNSSVHHCYYPAGTYYNNAGTLTVDPICTSNGFIGLMDPSIYPDTTQGTEGITRTGSNSANVYFSWGTINFNSYCKTVGTNNRPSTKPTSSDSGGTVCWCTSNYSDASYEVCSSNGSCSEAGTCYSCCANTISGSSYFRSILFQ